MPAIALERVAPDCGAGCFDDTDTATRKTVEKMCELIRQSCADPLVQNCARSARNRFGFKSDDQAALAWGVFWWMKHCVKFRLDELTMFQIGERNEQDLLIAPAVLVRMQNPSEDCDGFSMLSAALLTCLGVPVVIATVATEQDDPSRWSHVFLCAIVNGRVMPLDTSHGPAPGWMVPKHRIHRWQTWTLDGRPANVKIPSYQGLHGYHAASPRRGMGQVRVGNRMVTIPRIITKRGRGFGGTRGLGAEVCTTDSNGDQYCYDDGTGDSTIDYSNIDLTGLVPSVISPVTDANGNAVIGLPSDVTSATISAAASAGNCWDLATGASTGCPAGVAAGSGVSVTCPSGMQLSGGVCNYPTGSGKTGTATPNWAAAASSIANTVGQDLKAVIQQPQNLLQAQTWANLSAYLPIIGIGVLGVIVLTSFAGKK